MYVALVCQPCRGEIILTRSYVRLTSGTSDAPVYFIVIYNSAFGLVKLTLIISCNNKSGFLARVDWCSTDNGGCSHRCSDTEGGPACSCPEGHVLVEGKTCKGKVLQIFCSTRFAGFGVGIPLKTMSPNKRVTSGVQTNKIARACVKSVI